MYFDQFEQNQVFELKPVHITKELMLSFAKVYDPNKLHMDEKFGKTTRFGQIIAPGVMCFMLVWAQFIRQDIFGEQFGGALSTSIEWHHPVFAGDTLTSTATVTEKTQRNKYNGLVEITYDVYNQHGVHVMTDVTRSVILRDVK